LRTNLPERIEMFTPKNAPTAEPRVYVRCPPRSLASELLPRAREWFGARRIPPVGVRLRTNLPQRIKNLHTQKRPCGRTAELRSVPAAFARKRAPTAGNRMARCPPRSPCRSPLADEPSTTHPKSSHPKTPLRPDRRIAFGARRVRSQASSYRGQGNGSVPAAFPLQESACGRTFHNASKIFTPKNAPAAGPRNYVRCPPRSLASELLPRAIGWFGARRVRALPATPFESPITCHMAIIVAAGTA
jgi:hypothetical protein